jgi:uncharacterized protein (DUF1015 family)
MAVLTAFRALRPLPAAAAAVAAPPYDVLTVDEARAQAAGNPLSFLHVSRPEIDLAPGANPYADEAYARAAANLGQLRSAAPLVEETEPCLYVYRLQSGAHRQTGLAACYSIDEYEQGLVVRHERTRPDKEDDRTRHVVALRAQTGPVFLVYRQVSAIDRLVERVTEKQTPLLDFKADDGVEHTIWRVDRADQDGLRDTFRGVPKLYIADGHHRAASAARARQLLAGPTHSPGEWDRFLGVAFPHSEVRIQPYNRVVADLAGLTPGSLLAALAARFDVTDGPPVPSRRGEVSMFLDGVWRTVALGRLPEDATLADRLDVTRLQDLILGPLLGVGDVRTDKRVDFVGGARGASELEARVRSGAAAIAFSLFPVAVEDLMVISDAGGIMPPKSTWFEPKLRDGLLSHLV